MSHFLYLHKDLTNTPNVWKIGVAITPYSAVRARQKFCWQQFGLDYLWFGHPDHIQFIEERVKDSFWNCSGKTLQNLGTQTEIFKVEIKALTHKVNVLIQEHDLCVKEIPLDRPYVASNSGQCIFGIPSEKYAAAWLDQKVKDCWPDKIKLINRSAQVTTANFGRLFEEC